jgi:hypothetical protein
VVSFAVFGFVATTAFSSFVPDCVRAADSSRDNVIDVQMRSIIEIFSTADAGVLIAFVDSHLQLVGWPADLGRRVLISTVLFR